MILQLRRLEWDTSQSENTMDFTSVSIDQSILDDERQFQVRQRSLDQVLIQVDKKGGIGRKGGII